MRIEGTNSSLILNQTGSTIAFILADTLGVVHLQKSIVKTIKCPTEYLRWSISPDGKWLVLTYYDATNDCNLLNVYETQQLNLSYQLTFSESLQKIKINNSGHITGVLGANKIAFWESALQGTLDMHSPLVFDEDINHCNLELHPLKAEFLLWGKSEYEFEWSGILLGQLSFSSGKIDILEKVPYLDFKESLSWCWLDKYEKYLACAKDGDLIYLDRELNSVKEQKYRLHQYTNIMSSVDGKYILHKNYQESDESDSSLLEYWVINNLTHQNFLIKKFSIQFPTEWLYGISTEDGITLVSFNKGYDVEFKRWSLEGNLSEDKTISLSPHSDFVVSRITTFREISRDPNSNIR